MVPNVDSYYSKCCHTQGKAVKMLAAGAEHTAAVTESGKLYGWGWGRYGNLGLGDRCDQMVPVEVVAVNVSHNPFMFMYASLFSAFCFNIASLLSCSILKV
jgi:alpha-tubulin suppressor-like RCC1 family protein